MDVVHLSYFIYDAPNIQRCITYDPPGATNANQKNQVSFYHRMNSWHRTSFCTITFFSLK
jgi:hypothetical protein